MTTSPEPVPRTIFPFPDTPLIDKLIAKRDAYVKEHFPEVRYGGKPPGPRLLVQLRYLPTKTAGGIVLPDATRDFNRP